MDAQVHMDAQVEAVRLYQDETRTIEDIGEILGVSYSTVRRQLITSRVSIRETGRGYKKLSPEQEDALVRKYMAGYTARSLGIEYGLSTKRVEKYLSRLGVKRRVQ